MSNPIYRHRGWFKSSFSNGSCNCVLVMFQLGMVLVQDSKYLRDSTNDPALQPTIKVSMRAWLSFLERVAGNSRSHADDELAVEAGAGGATVLRSVANGETLYYTADEWTAFVAGVRDGEFDPVPVSV